MPDLIAQHLQAELAIVGAGPAGLAAAAEASDLGVPVTLIDIFPRPGGQYFKQTPPELDGVPDGHARPLLDRLSRAEMEVISDTAVWGIFPEGEGYLLCLYGPAGTPRRLLAKKVILAPGAYDRPVPFPGWTLPGVMTAGAALTLVKHQRLLPGRRFLLSGTGPLQLVLARHLLDAGGEVAAVLDANPFPWRAWRHAPAAWGQWERLAEGWAAWRTMRKAGAALRWGHVVRRAEGEGEVARAVIGPVGGDDTETIAVDTICLGHGLTPSVHLARQAGCEHRYDPVQQACLPVRDEWLQTTLSGIFVVGDGAGIGGKDVAQWEGRLAALAAARKLARTVAADRIAAVRRELARQRRFAAVLIDLFPASAHLGDLLTDDTVLCRCEEITVGEIRRVVAEGAETLNAVRMVTRAGMGRCQGRMCGGPVAELLARELGQPVDALGQVTPRPPVVPVPLEGLLEEEA